MGKTNVDCLHYSQRGGSEQERGMGMEVDFVELLHTVEKWLPMPQA